MGCGSSVSAYFVMALTSDQKAQPEPASSLSSSSTELTTLSHLRTPLDPARIKRQERRSYTASREATSSAVGEGPPPLSPPCRLKVELIPDSSTFAELDEFVRKTPESVSTSPEDLVLYLTSNYGRDLHKIRAIYCWVAFNIRYDTDRPSSDTPKAGQDAASVLRTGRSQCEGYSQLVHTLCRLAKIPCAVVHGISKGHNYDPEDVFTAESKANHSWNLVLVEGEWRPLDSTWSAGFLECSGTSRTFHRKFEERWFLTDPEVFVYKHFPLINKDFEKSIKYQLLSKPISIEHWSASLNPEPLAFEIGLDYLTHRHTVVDVTHDVTIKVQGKTRPLVSMHATLQERGQESPTKTSCNVLTSLDPNSTCTIYVRPPSAVTYLLEVYGRVEGQEGQKLYPLLSYVIRCQEPHADTEPFPDKTDEWGFRRPLASECGVALGGKRTQPISTSHSFGKEHFPFLFPAEEEGTVQIHLTLAYRFTSLTLKLSHARDIDLDLSDFTFLGYTDSGVTIRVRLAERGYYLLRVFASHPKKNNLHAVADLLLFSGHEHAFQPFPRVFRAAYQHCVQLLGPLVSSVSQGERCSFRVRTRTFSRLRVGGKRMEEKEVGVWEAEVTPAEGQTKISIDGKRKEAESCRLYQFTVQ